MAGQLRKVSTFSCRTATGVRTERGKEECRERGGGGGGWGTASHKSPIASGVRQLGRVSKSFLGARGRGGEVANQPLRPTPGSWNRAAAGMVGHAVAPANHFPLVCIRRAQVNCVYVRVCVCIHMSRQARHKENRDLR